MPTDNAELEAALEGLFSSRVRVKVLIKLVAPAGARYHARELAKQTGEHFNSVWQELKHLESLGLLASEKVGNQLQYWANPAFPLLPELRRLLQRVLTQPSSWPTATTARLKAPAVRAAPATAPFVVGETD